VDLAGNERLLFEYKKRNQGELVKRNKSVMTKKKEYDTGFDFYNPMDLKLR